MWVNGFVKLGGFILLLHVLPILCSFTYCTHAAIEDAKAITIILQNNKAQKQMSYFWDFFLPRIIMIKDPFPLPPEEDQGLLARGFFNDLGKDSNILPTMAIHPRGKQHMNIMDLFYFSILAKVEF